MKHFLKNIALLILCISAQNAFAVNPFIPQEEEEEAMHEPVAPQVIDTTDSELEDPDNFIIEENEEPDSAFSGIYLPGYYPEYDFYFKFDSMAIDAYRYDLRRLNSEFIVPILFEDCGFFVPHPGKTNSSFGWRRGRVHAGIDLQLNKGDTVRVAFDGVVRASHFHSGYGNVVIVRHYNGLETLYGHLSLRYVKPGDLINAGQVVGLGGSTGRSTGPHLHFETRLFGRPFDPSKLIDFKNDSLVSNFLVVNQKLFQLPYSKTNIKRGRKRRSSRRRRRRAYNIHMNSPFELFNNSLDSSTNAIFTTET